MRNVFILRLDFGHSEGVGMEASISVSIWLCWPEVSDSFRYDTKT